MSKFDRNRIKDGWEKLQKPTNRQTDRQTDKPTDTTKIMVTWPWTNIYCSILTIVWYLPRSCLMHTVDRFDSEGCISRDKNRLHAVLPKTHETHFKISILKCVSCVFGKKACNRIDNRLDVCLRDTAGCQTGCQTGCTSGLTTVLNEQPLFVQPVIKPQCTTGLTTGFTTGCIHDTTGCQTTTGCIVQTGLNECRSSG